MQSIGEIVKDSMGGLFTPISKTVKTCEKHGVEYEEIVYPRQPWDARSVAKSERLRGKPRK